MNRMLQAIFDLVHIGTYPAESHQLECVLSLMVIVVGNGIGDPSSNLRPGFDIKKHLMGRLQFYSDLEW